MNVQMQVIHGFSIDNQGGNPAGVVFDADNLTTEVKQAIAAKAGFPESAFVSSSKLADYKLDFFTPTKQIPHCGHATIATFSYLKSKGMIQSDQSSKETIDGLRSIRFYNGQAFMEQRAPRFESVDLDVVLESLHLKNQDLLPGLIPMIVNTGNSFLMIPVRDETVLETVSYNRDAVFKISKQHGLIGFYLFTRSSAGFDATTRMFGPFYGIEEEAATGMAAGPLACYLHEIEKVHKTDFKIEQGRFMKPPSRSLILVQLEMEANVIRRLFVGGNAHVSRTLSIEIADTETN